MAPRKRDRLIAVRLDEAEFKMLTELAGVDGISQSDVVRMQIRRGHAAAFGAPKTLSTGGKGSRRRKK